MGKGKREKQRGGTLRKGKEQPGETSRWITAQSWKKAPRRPSTHQFSTCSQVAGSAGAWGCLDQSGGQQDPTQSPAVVSERPGLSPPLSSLRSGSLMAGVVLHLSVIYPGQHLPGMGPMLRKCASMKVQPHRPEMIHLRALDTGHDLGARVLRISRHPEPRPRGQQGVLAEE